MTPPRPPVSSNASPLASRAGPSAGFPDAYVFAAIAVAAGALGALVALGAGWLVHESTTKDPLLAISNLNTCNVLFLTLGMLLHWRPARFLHAVRMWVPSVTGVLIQFPLYGGIAFMLTKAAAPQGEALSHAVAAFFISVSSHAAEAPPNLINPFRMLPLLGVLGLRARDVVGFTFTQLLVYVPLMRVLLTWLAATLQFIPATA